MSTAPRAEAPPTTGLAKESTAGETPGDTYFGTRVLDPFRALEDSEAASTKAWEKSQSELLGKYLSQRSEHDALARDAKALLDGGTLEAPVVGVQGGRRRYFFRERKPGMKQPVYYVSEGLHGVPRPVIDVGAMGATTALDWVYPSPKGNLVAWGASTGGSENSELRLRDVKTGLDVGERIAHTRHSLIAWLPDEKGFVYTRHPGPGEVPAGEEQFHSKLYLHVLGQAPEKDRLLFEPADKTWEPAPSISPDGNWLAVAVQKGWDKNDVYVASMSALNSWSALRVNQPFTYELEARNEGLYAITTDGAPRGQLVRMDYPSPFRCAPNKRCPSPKLETTVVQPEAAGTLVGASFTPAGMVLQYMENASPRVLLQRAAKGNKVPEVQLLASGGSLSVGVSRDGLEVFVEQRGFTSPGAVSLLAGGKLKPWRALMPQADLSGLVAERFEATSKDGTKVPYDVLRPKALTQAGAGVLYGYGGFNIAVSPSYSPRALMAATHGMVWAQAVLRGGSEFGEPWHQAGMKTRKQNVFDDYLAVAQDLMTRGLVAPKRLAAMGGSNGGLLVSAAITQRPDLFRAGVSMVPLTDMVRFPLFRLGKLWVSEYGDIAKEDEFRALYAYSPYHQVRQGTPYPAMLYTTAPNDTRVDPMHARKMVAALRAANAESYLEGRPVLLRIDQQAGHGAGKPTDKLAAEAADVYAFLLHELRAGK